ncbi:GyrI-like domain-containing protein [Hymenobacter nivis]|uniref:AraC family transcriptional regulator n=1 Tax=Hymenobacter nivis TaxID=1850093 RepID=A0A2Z3GQE5_9BACT|nr:GyrI-like domain-containing protein [Hymenobacter nivis]AWM33927.1 hypothetical protein DDQ68_14695 [Hymenobacter nivis]
MTTRYIFLAAILLSVLAVGAYGWLGGFRPAAVALETTATPVFLAGQAYAGSAQGDGFGPLFRRAKQVLDQGRLPGAALANLYYNNPETAHDTVRAFIGLAVADTLRPLPAGLRYRLVPAGQRVVAARVAGVSYLLSPNKLYPAALDLVKAQKLTPRNFYLERFGPGETAEVWIGVK